MPIASHIRHIFIAILLLASFGLQHGHGLAHMAEVFHTPHCKHEPTDSDHQLTHEHDTHENHCGICQLQVSPSFPVVDTDFSFVSEIFYNADRIQSATVLRDAFTGGTLSDRGPPCALI